MALRSPFYKVWIDNDEQREITELIESFSYEDSMEEDNLLSITLASIDPTRRITADRDFLTGVTISFQFGYLASEQSEIHRARITDRTPNYADRITLKLKCLDLGTKVKKVTGGKIWEGLTSTQIAKEIADKYSLDLEADETTKVWDAQPQGNKSDFDFLKYLASRESTGNYVCYIRNTTMYFINRSTRTDSLFTFTYGDGDSGIINFSPTTKESSQAPSSNKTKVSFVDPMTGETKESVADTETEQSTGTLGAYARKYDENGVEIKGEFNEVAKTIVTPVQDKEEADSLANATKKEGTLKSQVAKMTTVGMPLLTPNNIITMRGVDPPDDGNWLIVKITHNISPSGYTCTIALEKNGSNRKLNQNQPKVEDANESVGTQEGMDKKAKLRVFDGNGNFQGYSSNDKNASKSK